MKITVGALRKILRETLDEAWGDDKLDVGDWVVLQNDGGKFKGQAVEISKFEKLDHKGQEIWLCTVKTADGTSSQRADIMLDGARRATPEEIQRAQDSLGKEREWMAKSIDTSREGT